MPPRCVPLACLAFFLCVEPVLAAKTAPREERRLTLDWVFSEEGKSAASVPEHAWLGNGQAVLYDKFPAGLERTLEALDPTTGKRTRLVDPAQALESLTELLRPEEPLEELGWPDALDPRGRWAVYEKDDRLWLLDFTTSRFAALGAAEGGEKSPGFSPDGTKLAYVRDNDLYVRDMESATDRRLTSSGSETLLNGTLSWLYWEEIFGRRDLGYVWSPDSKAIAYLETDESGVSQMTYVDFEPAVPRVIHQRYPKTGDPNPRVRAGVLDLESGKTTWIDLGVYPYEYLVRLSWFPDGRRLAVQTLDRPQTSLDLFLAEAATGKVNHVLRETDPGWVNLQGDPVVLENRPEFLWPSERDGYCHLYRYAIDGTFLGRLTRGEWAVRSSGGGAFSLPRAVLHIDEARGWAYFTALEKSALERHLYRTRLDGTGMERLTREDGTHGIAFSPDGALYLDASSALDRLPSLTLHRADGSLVHTVSAARPEKLAPFALRPRELFRIQAADGFSMPALLIKPRSFDPRRRYPVVMYVYGGPSAPTVANAWGARPRDYYEQMLADRGFAVLYVDNRAATARSKTLENAILGDGYGKTELGDLLDAVKWLKAQRWVDPQRVGIWGWSGGGSFTLLALTRSAEFCAGVAVAPVSDWHYYDTKWAEAFMKRPQDAPEAYERTSHALRAKELHGRLLLVHGTYDDNVHPQNTWRFADELIEAGIVFDMMIYPMRKHDIKDDAAQKHLYATMLDFWERSGRRLAPSR